MMHGTFRKASSFSTGIFDTSTLSTQVLGQPSEETKNGEMTYQPGLLVFSGGTAFNNIAGNTGLFIHSALVDSACIWQ